MVASVFPLKGAIADIRVLATTFGWHRVEIRRHLFVRNGPDELKATEQCSRWERASSCDMPELAVFLSNPRKGD